MSKSGRVCGTGDPVTGHHVQSRDYTAGPLTSPGANGDITEGQQACWRHSGTNG